MKSRYRHCDDYLCSEGGNDSFTLQPLMILVTMTMTMTMIVIMMMMMMAMMMMRMTLCPITLRRAAKTCREAREVITELQAQVQLYKKHIKEIYNHQNNRDLLKISYQYSYQFSFFFKCKTLICLIFQKHQRPA